MAGTDLLHRLWHIFENIGLPGAVAGDYINRLRGAPTHEAARIVRDDELAAYVGGAFREVTLAGAGMRLPWAGRAMAGWTWEQETLGSVCGRPVDPASYVVDTLILIVTVRGGPLTMRNLPAIGSGGSGGGLGALAWIEHATLVQVHSGALAGAAAGVRTNRLVVLMAQGSGGPDGGDDWERILFSGKNDGQRREMLRMMQNWSKSTFDSIAESVVKHSRSHGWDDNFARYLSDADNFFRNTRGARSSGIRTDGSELLTKRNGEFIILRDGKIVTYGRNN